LQKKLITVLSFYSPAKINLFFHVIKKRVDGYHDIASIIQAIDLFDRIDIKISQKDQWTCSDQHLPMDFHHNLVIKALFLFRQKTQISTPLSIHLEKKIPIESGLGGGSSNAATILWALNELFHRPLSLEELITLGGQIGSDVPFFFSLGTAFCESRGEKVENFSLPYRIFGTLVLSPFGISTKKAYSFFHHFSKKEMGKILLSYKQGKPLFFNDLESAVFDFEPRLYERKKELLRKGFSQVTMTGSGSAFFCFGKELPQANEDPKNKPFLMPFFSIKRGENSWYSPKMLGENFSFLHGEPS
jgi:4-diphosphocytidyl-2-C-methyl-D-erythritol kinase